MENRGTTISTLKAVNCEISVIDKKRLTTFSDALKHVLKTLEVSQNSNTDLLKESIEYLKKELNSKDELIKSLVDTQSDFDTITTGKPIPPQKYNICWKPRLTREH